MAPPQLCMPYCSVCSALPCAPCPVLCVPKLKTDEVFRRCACDKDLDSIPKDAVKETLDSLRLYCVEVSISFTSTSRSTRSSRTSTWTSMLRWEPPCRRLGPPRSLHPALERAAEVRPHRHSNSEPAVNRRCDMTWHDMQ